MAHTVHQCQLQALQFSVHLIDLLSTLLRGNSFSGIQRAVVDQIGSRPSVSGQDIFLCKCGFGKCSRTSSKSNHWGCCYLLCKIYFLWHVTVWSRNGSLLLHRIREHNTSKWWDFWLTVSSWGTHLLNFSICFKCWITVEWLMSSSATSWVVIRGPVSKTFSTVVVQSLRCIWFFGNLWAAEHKASLPFTISQSLLKLMSIESMMPSNHLILCHPLLLLPSILPIIRVFSNESVLCIKWPNYWSISFSNSLSNEYLGVISFRIDWLDLLEVQGTLKSLFQHHSLKSPILWCSAFLWSNSHIHTWLKWICSHKICL